MAKKTQTTTTLPTINGLIKLLAPEALDFRPDSLTAGTEWRRVYYVVAFPPDVGD